MGDDRREYMVGRLREDVSRRFGRRLLTATDFERLAEAVTASKAGYISTSTMKRFYGYVSGNNSISTSTLNVLARYLGYADFNHYCTTLDRGDSSDSDYNSAMSLDVKALPSGSRLQLTWFPDRVVELRYAGDFIFEVISVANSRLTEGCRVRFMTLVKGQPLFMNVMLANDGGRSPIYVAGKEKGIDWRLI